MRVGFVNVLAACSVPCGDGFLFFVLVLKVADTLGNVLREAVMAEHLYGHVRRNMQRLHMAISHVEDVVGLDGVVAGGAHESGEERVSGAMLTGKKSNAPQKADVMQRGAMDATRMARLRAAMMLNAERRKGVVEGAGAQALLHDDRPGSQAARRAAGDGFAADELLLWSHAPEPLQASDARAARGLASVEASLSRLSAKFSRQAHPHAASLHSLSV